jgi:hypothetical protein
MTVAAQALADVLELPPRGRARLRQPLGLTVDIARRDAVPHVEGAMRDDERLPDRCTG